MKDFVLALTPKDFTIVLSYFAAAICGGILTAIGYLVLKWRDNN